MGLWSSIKAALSKGASNSASTGTGNTSKPASSATKATTTTTTKTTSTPVVSSSTPRTNSTDLSTASVPSSKNTTVYTSVKTTPTTSTSTTNTTNNVERSGNVSGGSTVVSTPTTVVSGGVNDTSAADKATLVSNLKKTMGNTYSSGNTTGYKDTFDMTNTNTPVLNTGEKGYLYQNLYNANALNQGNGATTPTTSGGTSDSGGVEVAKPTTDLINTDSDVTKGTEEAAQGKTSDDVANEITKISSGRFTSKDGKTYGYLNTSNGIQAQELSIFEGLLAEGYTEDQANQILNSAFAAKGIERKKNYQTEDGKWTYSVYADLNNEKISKLENAKSALGTTDTSGMTVTDAKNLYEQKLASLGEDYQKAVEDADKSEDITQSKKDTALAKRLQKKGLHEAANFQGLGSGNRTQEQLAMDEAYRNKLMELQELESDNTELLQKLKSEYEKDVADADNAYENLKTGIREENAAAKKETDKTSQYDANATALQESIDAKIEEMGSTISASVIMQALTDALTSGLIDRTRFDKLVTRYSSILNRYEGGE